METSAGRVRIFGIRHHGPGSARSLSAALERMRPDVLLIEGPPEADDLLALALHEDMQPPVALLIYAKNDPSLAVYYPYAAFSPEWQAVRYGLRQQIPVRMMDLAQSVQMALAQAQTAEETVQAETPVEEEPAAQEEPANALEVDTSDPLRMLAEAAGYADGEQWWEHMVEQYRGLDRDHAPEGLFAGIQEAMSALREALPPESSPLAALREAAMRQAVRAALQQGFQRVAVVCGAWHVPALLHLDGAAEMLPLDGAAENGAVSSSASQDERLLRGLPHMPVHATWVPWSSTRLTRSSGYGAGIDSPGWYAHLWNTQEQVATRWLIHAARMLREEGLDISPGHTIEAVRLAEMLAALRDRPLPGLPELHQAALSVFCFGNPTPLRLIEEKLIIGEALGSVPADTPAAPLQQDFEQQARRLRMKVETGERLLDLDLRKPLDLERSHLLHRLHLLELPWGRAGDAWMRGAKTGRGGTFHEMWKLKWWPEFTLLLIEAGQWGSTIAAAAAARACENAVRAPDLAALTSLVEDVLLAALPDAVRQVMIRLQHLAAVSSDTRHLMASLPPLAAVLRYGSVRQTDSAMVAEVVDGLVARVCIGLPAACAGLNDDAATEMFNLLSQVDDALVRLNEAEYNQSWQRALALVAALPNAHGLLAGRACRIRMDSGALDPAEAAGQLHLALSTSSEPAQAAAWVEGFLHGSGQILVHDERLLNIIDQWMGGLPEEAFTQLLPLLRRTFSSFARPERRLIGERIRGVGRRAPESESAANFDPQRADAVLPLLARLLGIPSSPAQLSDSEERIS